MTTSANSSLYMLYGYMDIKCSNNQACRLTTILDILYTRNNEITTDRIVKRIHNDTTENQLPPPTLCKFTVFNIFLQKNVARKLI